LLLQQTEKIKSKKTNKNSEHERDLPVHLRLISSSFGMFYASFTTTIGHPKDQVESIITKLLQMHCPKRFHHAIAGSSIQAYPLIVLTFPSEPQKNLLTFHCTGCLIGILIMV